MSYGGVRPSLDALSQEQVTARHDTATDTATPSPPRMRTDMLPASLGGGRDAPNPPSPDPVRVPAVPTRPTSASRTTPTSSARSGVRIIESARWATRGLIAVEAAIVFRVGISVLASDSWLGVSRLLLVNSGVLITSVAPLAWAVRPQLWRKVQNDAARERSALLVVAPLVCTGHLVAWAVGILSRSIIGVAASSPLSPLHLFPSITALLVFGMWWRVWRTTDLPRFISP